MPCPCFFAILCEGVLAMGHGIRVVGSPLDHFPNALGAVPEVNSVKNGFIMAHDSPDEFIRRRLRHHLDPGKIHDNFRVFGQSPGNGPAQDPPLIPPCHGRILRQLHDLNYGVHQSNRNPRRRRRKGT
jgi:hypothetical protein